MGAIAKQCQEKMPTTACAREGGTYAEKSFDPGTEKRKKKQVNYV